MATNATRSQQTPAANHAVLSQETGGRAKDSAGSPADATRKPAGYGLPCSKCRLYYPADLDICPICQHNERVSNVMPKVPPRVSQSVPDPIPDGNVVEREREEFLRQFKSQLLEAHAEVVGAPQSMCTLGEHRAGEAASAEVCKACYEHLQERLDILEGALQLEVTEAAQIIYDAVWADPSDPNKTYQNAASALLTELRKRAGMNSLLAPFQPLSD